jgi:hypothetical protein
MKSKNKIPKKCQNKTKKYPENPKNYVKLARTPNKHPKDPGTPKQSQRNTSKSSRNQ